MSPLVQIEARFNRCGRAHSSAPLVRAGSDCSSEPSESRPKIVASAYAGAQENQRSLISPGVPIVAIQIASKLRANRP